MPVCRIRRYRLGVCLLAAAALALAPAGLAQTQAQAIDLLQQPRRQELQRRDEVTPPRQAALRLLDLAIDVLAAGGGATVRDKALQTRSSR